MQTGSARIEALRFGLLIILTIGLLSVAFRIDSHSSSHPSSKAAHAPGVGGQSASPSSPSQVLPTATTRTPGAGSTPATSSGGSGTTSGTGTVAQAQPQLPVTGWQGALRLSALSLVLIGAGVMSVRAAGPRRHPPRRRVQD